MSKWFEVKVTKVTVYAVRVPDGEGEEEAQMAAADDAGDFDTVDSSGPIKGDENIDRLRRHADEVLFL